MVTTTPRPKQKDTHPAVAKKLAEELMSYSGHGLGEDPEEVAESIEQALDDAGPNYDGFAIGKELDDQGWEVDASMVEELDCADNLVEEELKVMTVAWMKETGYELPYKTGDAVTAKWNRKEISGKVHEIRMDGTVLISVEGENGCPVVQWENVQLANAVNNQ